MTAQARSDDLQTSADAAASIENLNARQLAVYQVLRNKPRGLTHAELCESYDGYYLTQLPNQTHQSIRSRCAELRDRGWVIDTGTKRRAPGRQPATVWRAVDVPVPARRKPSKLAQLRAELAAEKERNEDLTEHLTRVGRALWDGSGSHLSWTFSDSVIDVWVEEIERLKHWREMSHDDGGQMSLLGDGS